MSSSTKKKGGGSGSNSGGYAAGACAHGCAHGGADGHAYAHAHARTPAPLTNGKSSAAAKAGEAATATGQGGDGGGDGCRKCETSAPGHVNGAARGGGSTTASSGGSGEHASAPSAAPPPAAAASTTGKQGGPKPVIVDKAQVIRLAGQYTPCAGCSSAIKLLLQRPIAENRLLNAVMADDPEGNNLRLRDQYLLSPKRTAQLLETFPLQAITKKVQPQGGGLRCAVHKRAAAMQAGTAGGGHHHHHGHRHHHHHHHHHESWDWEDAWERLPAEMKDRVATLEVAALESAMHHATATHRFCVDCKHNVVTALDLLACRYPPEELENKDEYNAELFAPFAGRILSAAQYLAKVGAGAGTGSAEDGSGAAQQPQPQPQPQQEPQPQQQQEPAPAPANGDEGQDGVVAVAAPVDGRKVLACAVDDVEELISWHEDFDSQEYAASGQRHAATLEHGQREIRSLVGALMLSQLRVCWHAHTAQVQAEQYLFHLVVHALRMQLGSGKVVAKAAAAAPAGQGGPAGGIGGIDGAKAAELAASQLLEEVEADGEAGKKSKSRKKKERRAKAKARKAQSGDGDLDGSSQPDDEVESATAMDRRGSSSSSTASASSSSASPSPPPDGKEAAGAGGSKKEKQPETAGGAKGGKANGGPGLSLLQSCYDREAEERLLRALGADASLTSPPLVNGGGGLSLLDQLGPDDEDEEGDEDIDPALLKEMEMLKSSLEAKAEHREHLRSKLASQFQRYCSSAETGEKH